MGHTNDSSNIEAEQQLDLVSNISSLDRGQSSLSHDDAIELTCNLHRRWVENGKQAKGKLRHSVRYLAELLNMTNREVKSLRSKLLGETNVWPDDAENLIRTYLEHWSYTGDEDTNVARPENYDPFKEIDVGNVTAAILAVLFPALSAPEDTKIRPIRLKSMKATEKKHKELRSTWEILPSLFPACDAMITASPGNAVVTSDPVEATLGFRTLMDVLRHSDSESRKDQTDGLLIWIADRGGRRFSDRDGLARFHSSRSLASHFKALAEFDPNDKNRQELWGWLHERSVVVLGSLRPDEIDKCYGDIETELQSELLEEADLQPGRIILGDIPPSWFTDDNFKKLYGTDRDKLEQRTYNIFFRREGWDGHENDPEAVSQLRYFGFAPPKEGETSRDDGRPEAFGAELPSPEQVYDRAFKMVYQAARQRLSREKDQSPSHDALTSLIHLRHMNFAVLRLDQFIELA